MNTTLLICMLCLCAVTATAGLIPADEEKILRHVAKKYKLNPEQTALLLAIRRVENGGPGKELGVEVPRAQRYRYSPVRSLITQGRWASGTIIKHYDGDIWEFGKRYCPVNATVWAMNAKWAMSRQGFSK